MRSEPILARILRWGLWASALVPLIIFKEYISPFHFGKVIVFRSAIEVMLVMYVVLIWQDRSYRPKLNAIGWTFLGFTLAFTLSTITSVAPYFSFWGTLERMGGLFSFWHYFAFYMMLTSVFRERKHWQVMLELVIISAVISAFYGFLQKTDWTFILGSGGRQRPFGTIGNPALFAGYQILGAFLAGTLSFRSGISSERRWWYRFASVSMFLAVFVTAVRGSLIAVIAGSFVFALLWSAFNASRRAKMSLIGIVGAVAVFVVFALSFKNTALVQDSPYLRRVTDFSSQTYTVQTRFWAWSAGLQGWQESPKTMLLGWGPENFNVPFSKYFNPKFFRGPGSETFFDRAHNMFIEVLVTMGLAGLMTYLSLFAAVFWASWKLMHKGGDERLLGMGFASLTVAYAIHNAFIFDTSANFITFFTLLGFLSFVYTRTSGNEDQKQRALQAPLMSAAQLIVLVILLISSVIVLTRFNIRPAQANHTTTQAIVAGWQGQFANAMNRFQVAVEFDTFGVYEERQRMAQYLLEVNSQVQGIPEPFREALEYAITETEKNTLLNKQDYLPLLYIARLNVILGAESASSPHNDRALEFTAQALELSPTFVRTYYEVAQAYLNKGELENAYEWFSKAQQLNPEVGITYWYMAVVRIQLQDFVGGIELIESAIENGYSLSKGDIERLVGVYAQVGDFSTVIELLEGLLEDEPGRVQFWASLAHAYEAAGRLADAVAAHQKAIDLDEAYTEEGQGHIDRLTGGSE